MTILLEIKSIFTFSDDEQEKLIIYKSYNINHAYTIIERRTNENS